MRAINIQGKATFGSDKVSVADVDATSATSSALIDRLQTQAVAEQLAHMLLGNSAVNSVTHSDNRRTRQTVRTAGYN